MKKKQIEKVPYLKLPKRSRKKTVKYIAMTAVKNIGHERNIFLEIYKNEKGCQEVPVIRYVATKKDWGVFFPEDGTWTRQKITTNDYYEGLIWQQSGEDYRKRSEQNILYTEKDMERIEKFFKGIKIWQHASWWEYFEHNETAIKNAKVSRRYELRRQRLEERKKATPELPEKELLNWAESRLFRQKHYLYYKKRGRFATICCSKCGGVKEGSWKSSDSYESQFERHVAEPINKLSGICPLCGTYGEYKTQGSTKGKFGEKRSVFLANKYREKGAVIRYVEIEHAWYLDEILGDKGEPEMYGAHEEFSGVEIARSYIEPGKSVQRDFQKHDGWRKEDFWDDCNLYGMYSIPIHAGGIYPTLKSELEGTCLQYSAIEKYVAAVGEINVMEYMERYSQFPQMEMLVKMGLTEIVKEMVKGYCGVIYNSHATRPYDFLGINKNHMKDLIEENGNTHLLKVMNWERSMGQSWNMDQIRAISESMDYVAKIETAMRYMSMEQLLNRIEKYAGTTYEAGRQCSTAMARIKHTATLYLDYLDMRVQTGYDLNNSVFAYPRSLENAHQKMVNEQNKNKVDERLKEVKERYPEIRKKYRTLRKKYFFEDENFVIRPARSAEEIVTEGRMLHHCVGGDGYLRKHSMGETCILMLRMKDKPDVQYITVEIMGTEIRQWYGAYDKKPDQENMDRWLSQYTTRLKATGQATEQIAIMAAV